jgi:5-methyltetrahydrofolate--homocysteine methyltransferase
VETKVIGVNREIIIKTDGPVVLMGERINPTGREKFTTRLLAGDLNMVRNEAMKQINYGASILDVNVGAPGIDEVVILPKAVKAIQEVIDVPLSLDSHNSKALEEALKVYKGKPIVNSVNGQEQLLTEILPIVRTYGTSVIGLVMDDNGIPADVESRLKIAYKIVERAERIGISRSDIIIDALVTTVSTDDQAGIVTLQTIKRIKQELGVNQSLGVSNISFGLPDREVINSAFLTLAIDRGATCLCVNVARMWQKTLAAELILGRDRHALRYIREFRQRQAMSKRGSEAGND